MRPLFAPLCFRFLSSAPAAPSSDSNVELVLITAGVVAVVSLLAMGPILLARAHRQREAIVALLVLWGLATAGSISYSIMQQMDWATTYTQRVETGYYDPEDTSDRPRLPIPIWCGLGVGYAALAGWAARGKASVP